MNAGILAPGYAPPVMPRGLLGNPQPVPMPYGVAGDPYWNSVVLYLPMIGPHGSTTFTDASPARNTVSRFGNTQLSGQRSLFGDTSAFFDGNGDYLNISGGGSLGTIYTIEGFVWFNTFVTNTNPHPFEVQSASNNRLVLYRRSAANGRFSLYTQTPVTFTDTQCVTIPTINTWFHFAAVRNDSTISMYINGTLEATSSLLPATTNWFIGTTGAFNVQSNQLNGYIAHLRITRGVARYTSSFAPITAPFPTF